MNCSTCNVVYVHMPFLSSNSVGVDVLKTELTRLVSTLHKLELSEMRELKLRKCLCKILLEDIFLISD